MAKISVDFSNVGTFEALPEGQYDAVIESVELRTGKTTGNPYLNFTLTVTEGEYEGRKLWMTAGLTEKSLWKLKDMFAIFGIEQQALELDIDEDTKMLVEPDLSGLPIAITVVQEEYDGKPQTRVDDIVKCYQPLNVSASKAKVK